MSSNIFDALLEEKIRVFVAAYGQTAHQVFYDEEKKRLRHTGEYGGYREILVREFLRFFTPGRLDVHNGFIINAGGEVSTQCDIVIYDSKNTPLIESGERQRFFTGESVCGIGEVKSTLSKADLKTALNKLARIKAMREKIPAPTIVRRERDGKFDPSNYAYDQLPTFLLCQKLDFDFQNLVDELDGMYDANIERRHRHNLVLSLEDGIFTYADKNKMIIMFPEIGGRIEASGLSSTDLCKHRFVQKNSSMDHIKLFCSFVFMLSSSATILYPDISSYMSLGKPSYTDQK